MPSASIEALLQRAIESHRAGQFDQAAAGYLQVLAADPTHAVALNLVGVLTASQGQMEQAIAYLRRATQSREDYAEAHFNLGKALQDADRTSEAAESYRRALELKPAYAKAGNNLGVVLQKLGLWNESLAAYEQALRVQPIYPEAHFNRGTLLEQTGRLLEALDAYRAAVAQQADYADALINLGNLLQKTWRFDEAIQTLELAIKAKPTSATAFNALGNALKETGRMDQAMQCFRHVVELGGNHFAVGNYLYCSHFHPAWDAKRIYAAHLEWNERFAASLMPVPTAHVRVSDRLRVGFVSPDFREHPVGRFMLPLAENLDRSRFEIHYFSHVAFSDAMTARFKSAAEHWHETSRLSDAELAEFVSAKQIDVLIDLTMHMQGSRLMTFARKPAPLQMTYLAYCSTTGLRAIDYRISDPFLDPVGSDESVYSEKTARLAHTYWCYRAPAEAGPIINRNSDEVVFGCLNNYCKIVDATWEAWISILLRVERSRLLIFSPEGSHREAARDRLRKMGVDPSRLQMVSRLPKSQYFQTFGQIDIALDPFPYGGGTTTLDGLWSGVPTVSLIGQTAVGRGGASILSNIGHPEWLAHRIEQYVDVAVDLSRQRVGRARLREELASSPLMNERAFATDFSDLVANCWRGLRDEAV